jgi:excisionase family DNA binding protein
MTMDNVTPLPTPDQDPVGTGSQREKGGITDFDGLPVLISVPRAAELLGISRASAYRYAESGELPVKRFGGRVLVVRDRLRDLLEAA